MVRSFDNLMRIDPGVEADRAIVVSVQLGASSCRPTCWSASSIMDEIKALPGVEQAAVSASGPLGGGMIWPEIRVEGSTGVRSFDGAQNHVSPGFFEAAGIRLIRGRDFAGVDEMGVAIVNEAFASRYLNGDPLGQRFYAGTAGAEVESDDGAWMEIVGIANNTRNRAIRQFSSGATFYTPSVISGSFFTLTVRTAGDPEFLAVPIQQIIRTTDRFADVRYAQTLEQALYESAALPRFYTALFGSFGVFALVLAIVGVYGVTSYAVVQRTHEVGVRMALGAQGRHVVRRLVAEKAGLAFAGILLGLAGAAALARSIEHMLFEIRPIDPATFISVAALLFIAALAACYLPARAATRVSPVAALRHE
jgi:putative ABC transport system permease protein